MLVFYSPETYVFLTTRHKFISFHWTKFNGEDVEIADLFGQKSRFPSSLNLTDIEY